MKKLAFRLVLVLVVLLVVAVLAVGFFLDAAVRRGIITVGPMVTKTDIQLKSVSLSLLSGSGTLKGLVVGNPEGYKSPSAIQVGSATLALKPSSVLADKVVIKSIKLEAPEITFETDLKGNNLSKLVANLQAATGGDTTASPPKDTKPAKKLQVDDFLISGGKINVAITALGSKSATVPLPEIHLTALGQGPDGITPAELTKQVLQAIEKEAVQASAGAVTDLSKSATGAAKDLSKDAAGAAKSIGNLFKK